MQQLNEIQAAIDSRFLEPFAKGLKQALGTEGANLAVEVNWDKISDLVQTQTEEDILVAEQAIQTLQLPNFYDAVKKGVIRYISEDKAQLKFFVKHIKSFAIEFNKGTAEDETEVEFYANTEELIYRVNIVYQDVAAGKQQDLLTGNEFFECLEDTLNEHVDKIREEEEMYTIVSSPPSSSTPLPSGAPHTVITSLASNVEFTKQHLAKMKDITVQQDGHFDGFDDEIDHNVLETLKQRGGEHDEEYAINHSNIVARTKSAIVKEFQKSPRSPSPRPETGSNSSSCTTSPRVSSASEDPASDFDEEIVEDTSSSASTTTSSSESELLKMLSGKPVDDLKIACKLPMIGQADMSPVKKVLQLYSDKFWRPSEAEKKMMNICRKYCKAQAKKKPAMGIEKHVKSWIVTKINNRGFHQERVLVLTTKRYYTVKYDKEIPGSNPIAAIDEKHFKQYELDDLIMMDVNRFKPSPTDKKPQPFAICIFARDKVKEAQAQASSLQKSSSFSNAQSTLSSPPPLARSMSMVDDRADYSDEPKEEKKEEKKEKKKKENLALKLARKGTKFIKKRTQTIIMGKEEKKPVATGLIKPRERPNTDLMDSHIFMCPDGIHQSDLQQKFLEEVAWIMYATAAVHKGTSAVYEPFTDTLIKKPTVTSFLFDKIMQTQRKPSVFGQRPASISTQPM